MPTDDESAATTGRAVMAVPEVSDGVPGLVTETTLVMVQSKLNPAAKPELSVTVMVTGKVPAVVGVPLMTPEPASMDSPVGRVPLSLKSLAGVTRASEALSLSVLARMPRL